MPYYKTRELSDPSRKTNTKQEEKEEPKKGQSQCLSTRPERSLQFQVTL